MTGNIYPPGWLCIECVYYIKRLNWCLKFKRKYWREDKINKCRHFKMEAGG